MWRIKVPASSANLGSGLDTLGLAVSLWLDCTFTPARSLTIDVLGQGAGMISRDEDNLVWQSAEIVHRGVANQPMPRGRLTISSEIPLGRGLGSSAAAVVAGILLANACLDYPLSLSQLFQWAVKIEGHPDNVGAALYGGVIMAWTREDDFVAVQQYNPPNLTAILIIPDYLVPTKEARSLLPDTVSRQDAVFNAQRVALWIHALATQDWSLLRYATQDRLHQPYRKVRIHGMDEIFESALAAGAVSATISGSGPTILVLAADSHLTAVTEAIANTLAQQNMFSTSIKATSLSLQGAHFVQEDHLGFFHG